MIISHCKPHLFLMQLREFDVPLIVFLSGVSFVISSKKSREQSYLAYCWKRFKRLVFPTWIFLCIYYMVLFVGLSVTGNLEVDWSSIIHNYTLMTGWYVWIIRVFLIIALLSPPVYIFSKRLNFLSFTVLFIALLIGYEFISEASASVWYYYLTMTIPYVLIFAFGTLSDRITKKQFLSISIVSFVVFIVIAFYFYKLTGSFQGTQICKYPPRLYYTSYAIAIVCLLWLAKDHILKLSKILMLSNLLTFVGSHTLWIYFWHIILLLILEPRITNNILLFTIVIVLAVLIDYIQVLVIKKVIRKSKSELFNKNVTILFLG